ncbi:uncharacterized protein [Nicotiana sylvestris]|uniref:uncharacterized protein n=1 Tax=Nicotiana sylvestris TaxID=4096 RepID=UPI00388CEAF3
MVDAGYTGLRFTWYNTRGKDLRIWKRLDRVFFNNEWTENFSIDDIGNMASTGSDQTPMLVKCSTSEQEARDVEVDGNCMRKFQLKHKHLSRKLSKWSREEISNVFEKVKKWEQKMQSLEADYIENDMEDVRPHVHKDQAEHTGRFKCEEAILRQKGNINWLEEGDSNTKYFYAIINDSRRKLIIERKQKSDGQWLSGGEDIANEAVYHFFKFV